jgi:acyl carrier protein
MDVRAAIRKFITEDLLFGDESGRLDDNSSLTSSGMLDSTGMIELVTFIEAKFGLQIADEEMLPENLDSISRVEAFVNRKLNDKTP